MVNVIYFLKYLICFIEMLDLEDTLNTISETPEKTVHNIKENNQIIDDNLIHQRPSTSLCTSWTP